MTQASGVDLSRVAVVIPCYRSARSIVQVVSGIPQGIRTIVCVNDASDDGLGSVLDDLARNDDRVSVVTHDQNRGVGGATITGYRHAMAIGVDVIVKIDSDGQMNPAFIPELVEPIISGEADYVKGNRFFDIDRVRRMPVVRLIGNAGLTFLTRISSGYWDVADPTNGYTAIHSAVASLLPLDKLHRRYFFESDILFRLNSFGAVVAEQPVESRYGNETSHLSVVWSLLTFPFLHLRNLLKRLFYNYFLRNFDVASLYLIAGVALEAFGIIFGASAWQESARSGMPATTGTVMLSVLPLILGFQLLLAFLHHDVVRTPRVAIQRRINSRRVLVTSEPGRLEQS